MIDFGSGFEGMFRRILILWILCILFVPLGIWKAVELFIWARQNVHMVIGGAK